MHHNNGIPASKIIRSGDTVLVLKEDFLITYQGLDTFDVYMSNSEPWMFVFNSTEYFPFAPRSLDQAIRLAESFLEEIISDA